MKGVVITTDAKMFVKDFTEPLHESVGAILDGPMENTHPRLLNTPLCMIVNEEGKRKNLPVNVFGSVLYLTVLHGDPIVGNIVIMAEGIQNGEIDFIGLTDEQIAMVKDMVRHISDGDIEEVAAP